jgi:cytochrome c553
MRGLAALLLCLGGLPSMASAGAPVRAAPAHPAAAVLPATSATSAVAPVAAPAAPDPLNGKLLYTKGPRGGGAPACASCHGASPVTNAYGIRIAGDNPTELTHAFNSVVAMRSYQFATRFTSREVADLAAFIGNPAPAPKPAAK